MFIVCFVFKRCMWENSIAVLELSYTLCAHIVLCNCHHWLAFWRFIVWLVFLTLCVVMILGTFGFIDHERKNFIFLQFSIVCLIKNEKKCIKYYFHFFIFPCIFCPKMNWEEIFYYNEKYFSFLTFSFKPNKQNTRKSIIYHIFFSFS